MHEGAYSFIAEMMGRLEPRPRRVVELGSRTVGGDWPYSGPVRPLFGDAQSYTGVDIMAGPNVDVVADAAHWSPDPFVAADMVVCCETLEHTEMAKLICRNAWFLLRIGGVFLCTAAGQGRAPHSAVDGGPLRTSITQHFEGTDHPGIKQEFYRNVLREQLVAWLDPFGVTLIDTSTPTDIYALAVRV